MLLRAHASGAPAVGIDVLGRADDAILDSASRFVRHAGSNDPVLLAMATGRVVSRDIRVPRLNTSSLFIVTPARWWIADVNGGGSFASGAVKNIVGAFTASDGVTVGLSEKKTARFVVGRMNAAYAKTFIDGILAHARLSTAPFDNIAPAQQPVLLIGTHVSGRGTELEPGDESVVAISGRGICATGQGSVLLRPADSLRAIQVGGVGEYMAAGGRAGGAFAVSGALDGAAFARLMNTLTMRRHVDCVVRFAFDDAEATFSLAGDVPPQLQFDVSALIAALHGRSVPPKAQALRPATVEQRTPPAQNAPTHDAVAGFCGFCGAQRVASHRFCAQCGNPYG